MHYAENARKVFGSLFWKSQELELLGFCGRCWAMDGRLQFFSFPFCKLIKGQPYNLALSISQQPEHVRGLCL